MTVIFPILILDPGNFTPYYEVNLAEALANLGAQVEWFTSAYLFERVPLPAGMQVRQSFFTIFDRLGALGARARGMPRLRRMLKAISYPFEMLAFTRELRRRAPGILHIQWLLMPGWDGLLLRLWRHWGWRIVYTVHDVLPNNPPRERTWRRGWTRIGYRWLYRAANALIVHGESNRRALIGLGVAADQVHTFPMGDLGRFIGLRLSPEEARAQLVLDPHKPLALFFGLIKPYKGLGVLLRSLAKARERLPDVHLVIAGEPMEPLSPYLKLITSLGLADHVTVHPHYIPSDLVSAYFCAADVVVLPYLDVSLSAVLLTAYNYARPVVVTNVGGLPEMVEEGHTGLVVPSGDADALAGALASLLADRARCRAMGERAQQLAKERHAWPAIASRTLELYERVWRERKAARPT